MGGADEGHWVELVDAPFKANSANRAMMARPADNQSAPDPHRTSANPKRNGAKPCATRAGNISHPCRRP